MHGSPPRQLNLSIALVLAVFAGVGILIPGFSTIPGELLPEFSDVLFGIICAAGAVGSLVFVAGAGVLLDVTGSYKAIFLLLAAACTVSLLAFQFFGRTRVIDTAAE